MKLTKIILASSFLVGLVVAMPVLAQFSGTQGTSNTGLVPETNIQTVGGVVGVLQNVVKWAYTIFFIVAVFFFLMAAFYYLTAAGDPEKVKKAKDTLIYAAVATVVALLSFGLTSIIKSFIAGQ